VASCGVLMGGFSGLKIFHLFLDLFLGGWRKATAIGLSLCPSGFAPAFGRVVAASRRLRRGAEAPLYLEATARATADPLRG